MAFRGMYDVAGHGTIPVYDYENEVPTVYMGKKVGIVESTASSDLQTLGSSTYTQSPGPIGIFGLIAIIAIVIGVVIVTFLFTATSVTETPEGYYVQVPGATYFVDPQGNIISQEGTPTFPEFTGTIKLIFIGVVAVVMLYIGVKYLLPALTSKRGSSSRG